MQIHSQGHAIRLRKVRLCLYTVLFKDIICKCHKCAITYTIHVIVVLRIRIFTLCTTFLPGFKETLIPSSVEDFCVLACLIETGYSIICLSIT